ncbi:MAG: hypothetical protein JNK73_02905 [Bacteroidia bacterium]|nr:hypothetical protein [Bacteroidia bacterium]
MNAAYLLNESLTALRLTDTVAAALDFMAEQEVTVLPVVDKHSLHNYARAVNLLHVQGDKKLEEVIPFNTHAPRIYEHQHLYEMVPVFAAGDLQVLAVFNRNEEFIGIVDQKEIHRQLAQSLTYKGIGAILVLMVEPKDFAPSHIHRLVEENGAKVLGMMLNTTEAGNLQVNLKLNTTVVSGIVASLNRFGFRVTDCYLAEDYNKEDNREFDTVLRFFDL